MPVNAELKPINLVVTMLFRELLTISSNTAQLSKTKFHLDVPARNVWNDFTFSTALVTDTIKAVWSIWLGENLKESGTTNLKSLCFD